MTTIAPHFPACPDWCQIHSRFHRDDYDGNDAHDGLPVRDHGIEYDDILARTHRPAPGTREHPSVFVEVTRRDKMQGADHVTGEPHIALETTGFPHFTVAEVDALIAVLTDAKGRAVEIAAE